MFITFNPIIEMFIELFLPSFENGDSDKCSNSQLSDLDYKDNFVLDKIWICSKRILTI